VSDADIGVLAAIKFENVKLHDPVDCGDQDLPPAQTPATCAPAFKIRIADRVEHDVGALCPPVSSRMARRDVGSRRRSTTSTVELAWPSIGLASCGRRRSRGPPVPQLRNLRRGLADLAVDGP